MELNICLYNSIIALNGGIMMFNNLKEKRKNVGLTQYKLADLVGLTQSQISKTENGKRNLKNAETIKIAKALNISPEELFFSDEKEG